MDDEFLGDGFMTDDDLVDAALARVLARENRPMGVAEIGELLTAELHGPGARVVNIAREQRQGGEMKPDYNYPFASLPEDAEKAVTCWHCGDTYLAKEIVYEIRGRNPDPFWWCRNKHCDGAGLGFDIHFVNENEREGSPSA
jgi:hypothetical protein